MIRLHAGAKARVRALALVGSALLVSTVPARASSPDGRWTPTGPMLTPRFEAHTATLLKSGRVLVAGGNSHTGLVAEAEVYDPLTNTWRQTGAMSRGRSGHAAALLEDGTVLVAGNGVLDRSSEIYRPDSGTWRLTGQMSLSRLRPTATLLEDGRVLAAGGVPVEPDPAAALDSTEIYAPSSGVWTHAASMPKGRSDHTASRLNDGTVLVTGGRGAIHEPALSDVIVYDPRTDAWRNAPHLLTVGRALHSATVLRDGSVLVLGGTTLVAGLNRQHFLSSGEQIDPVTGAESPVEPMPHARAAQNATLLDSGQVLVEGGFDGAPDPTAWLYDPQGKHWIPVRDMPVALDRSVQSILQRSTATLLSRPPCGRSCGKVLVVGEGGRAYLLQLAAPPGQGEGVAAQGSSNTIVAVAVAAGSLAAILLVGWVMLAVRRGRRRSA